jgi:hypothetical protein
VSLGNGNETYPNGDNIQTVVPWEPDGLWQGISNSQINAALDEIDAGLPNGQRFSKSPTAGKDKAAWTIVISHCPDKTEQQARAMVNAWAKGGLLFEEDYDDPIDRHKRKGLHVDDAKRPGTTCDTAQL